MAKAPLEIKSLARQHTEAAVKTLVAIMRQPKAPAAARVAAAQTLLDRGYGKATQHIEGNVKHSLIDILSELERGEGHADTVEEQPSSVCH